MRSRGRVRVAIAVAFLAFFVCANANAQERATATDFTVSLFQSANGELSPDVFKIEEFGAHNFTFQGKGLEGGKFSGFLVRVRFEAPREVFAPGRQAQIVFRDSRTKKVLKTWNISDVYVGDSRISWRAQFFTDLDCNLMEVTLTSGSTKITREVPLHCGE